MYELCYTRFDVLHLFCLISSKYMFYHMYDLTRMRLLVEILWTMQQIKFTIKWQTLVANTNTIISKTMTQEKPWTFEES